jgi:hypothetical protein
MAELDRCLFEELPATDRTCVAGVRLSNVGEARVVVAIGLHPSQMPAVAVCPSDVLALA